MSTMMGNTRRVICFAAAGAVMAVFATRVAQADVASDRPGAVLIFPKIVVDTSGTFGPPTDTEIQLTNTSNSLIAVRCFLVDATSHCSDSSPTNPRPCTAENEAAGGPATTCASRRAVCLADTCSANDFRMTLTKRQPIAWKASEGLNPFPCDGLTTFCHDTQSNKGLDGSLSSIPNTQENPFFGEMKCVEVDPETFEPIAGLNPANNFVGDLKAEVTIVSKGEAGAVDARKYNAIAFESTPAGPGGDQGVLVLGGPDAEYNGGPNVLTFDHFFDDASVVTHKGAVSGSVKTDLTVVPVTEDLSNSNINRLNPITLQFLVFNEFEQRFSTSSNFSCWRELQLSDIDTRVGAFGNEQSIFNFAVEGTLTGQTRIRSVAGAETANTVVGIAEQFWSAEGGPEGRSSTASNIHFAGTRDQADQITLHPDTLP
jgi:hypothetical protein